MKNLWIPKTMRNEGFKFKALSRRPSPKRKFIFQPLCVQEQAVTCQGCNRLGGFHLTLGEVRVGSDWGSLKQVSNIFVSMDNNFPTKRGWQWHRGKKSVENIAFRNNGNWKVIWYTPRKFVKTEYNYPKLPYSKRHRLSQILMFAIYYSKIFQVWLVTSVWFLRRKPNRLSKHLINMPGQTRTMNLPNLLDLPRTTWNPRHHSYACPKKVSSTIYIHWSNVCIARRKDRGRKKVAKCHQ